MIVRKMKHGKQNDCGQSSVGEEEVICWLPNYRQAIGKNIY